MAKKKLFRKARKAKVETDEDMDRAAQKKVVTRVAEESPVGEALEEIEAEEQSRMVPSSIEDELLELEGSMGISPEPPGFSRPDPMSDKLDEIFRKMSQIDNAIYSLKDESRQFQEHLSSMGEEVERRMAESERKAPPPESKLEDERMEMPEPETRPVRPPREIRQVSQAQIPTREEMGYEYPDIPPFRPYGFEIIDYELGTQRFTDPRDAGFSYQMETVLPPFVPGKEIIESQRALDEISSTPEKEAKPSLDREIFGEDRKKPILAHIEKDYLTLVLVMRWIEFLFERIQRDKISLVLDYYRDLGWISEDVKSEIMAYARGEMQDVTKYMEHEEVQDDAIEEEPAPPFGYKKVEDWRLSADDHLKSLLFIMKIAGREVNKDALNSLELTIKKFKQSLEGFHGI